MGMNYIKTYKLFENSDEEVYFRSNKSSIKKICEEFKIKNYSINPDGTVNVDGDVDLSSLNLKRLPLRFGIVHGNFDCSKNKLTSLEGSPKEITKDFLCHENNLNSLKGGPKKVTRAYECHRNQLTSLEGSPIQVNSFKCCINQLTNLEGGPRFVTNTYNCSSNLLTSLHGAPEKVYDFNCSFNKLKTLEGCPPELSVIQLHVNEIYDPKGIGDIKINKPIEGWTAANHIHAYETPLEKVIEIFGNDYNFMQSLKYNYFMGGNKISESRFVEACDDLGVAAPDEIEGYEWV